MSEVSKWILSIAGAALIGVLIDIILPEGQIQKYCRSVFALILLLIIITPIPKLINKDISFSNINDNTAVVTDQKYLESIYKSRLELLEKSTQANLAANGFEGVEIKIYVNEYSQNMRILSVMVNMKNLVITAKNPHIDYYNEILGEVSNFLGIPRSVVSGIQ